MKAAPFAQGDQLFHHRAQILGFRQCRHDLLMLDQRCAHVGEHGPTMLGRAIELAIDLAVTHRRYSVFPERALLAQ